MTGSHRAPRRTNRLMIAALAIAALLVAGGLLWARPSGDGGHAKAGVGSGLASRSMAPVPSGMASRSESPSPQQSPQQSERRTIVIHAAGDTSLDPNWITTLRSQGWDYPWSGLKGIFEDDDLSILNLECPVAAAGTGTKVDKQFNFLCDPRGLAAMRRAGVEVPSLANNHAYDYGPEALLASLDNIREAGMTPLGAGRDDEEAEKPAIFHIKGWTVAVVGWDYVLDPDPTEAAAPGHPGTAFGHDFNAVRRAVQRIDRRVDLTIVQTHWGVELETRPNPSQVVLGHRLIEAGADMIFGGHSHRIQPLEIYRGKPIFWSLGNFVWVNQSVEGATSGVAEVTVKANGQIKARLLAATITAPGHPVLR